MKNERRELPCWLLVAHVSLLAVATASAQPERTARPDSPHQAAAEQKTPTLTEILLGDVDQGMLLSETIPPADQYPPPTLDEAKLKSYGLRKLTGRHVIVWTDLAESPEVDSLARLFDEGVKAWGRYFLVADEQLAELQLTGYVMKQEKTFADAGLVPSDLPRFLHGYQRGYEFWVRDQPSDYYRRHLLLHEGVHGFMNILLGGTGPPWYREGMAEHLATHRVENGKLQVGVMPRSRDEVPHWGRIKILQDRFAADEAKMLNEVMQLGDADFLETEGYAWAWAAVAYLDGHPAYRKTFRRLRNHVEDNPIQFSRRLLDQMAARLRQFDEQWQLFVVNMNYGYDFEAEAVRYAVGIPLIDSARKVKVAVDRGWQSTGIRLSAGRLYRVSASGRYQIRQEPEVWWSEPGGVTITYYRGMPLGVLKGGLRLDKPQPGVANLGMPIAIGLQRHLRPSESGTLYLRINDFPGEIRDNVGEVSVVVTEVKPGEQQKSSRPSSSEASTSAAATKKK